MVLAKIFFSPPCGFLLGMVAPLNFAKLDNLAAGDSAGILKNPMAPYLSVVSQPSLHGTSSTEKRGTHRELRTILQVIPICKKLLPFVPKLCMVPQNVVLTSP